MKKTIALLCACLFALSGLMAQSLEELDAHNRELLKTVHARKVKPHFFNANAPAPVEGKQVATKRGEFRDMPDKDVWFPGEWEEVQAIVVTPFYRYLTANGQDVEPTIPGYAATSYFNDSLRRYTPMLDTSSSMAQVSFYLMDGIQLGGAEAWVHIESAEDSISVLTHLATKGLRHDNIRFFIAPGCSFWYRDCGPICFYFGEEDSVGMLDFEYYAGRALDDSLPVYLHRQFGLPNFPTSIEWEGGNCLVDGTGFVMSSDQIYETNSDNHGQIVWDGVDINSWTYAYKAPLTHAQVNDSLAALIGPRGVGILPHFLHDGGTGHIDLYADMFDENQFVFSVMPTRYRTWEDYAIGNANMATLTSWQSYFGNNYKSTSIPFPRRNASGGYFVSESSYESFTRTYSNHTFVNNVILQPCFTPVAADGLPTASWDRQNILELQEAYPGYTIYCVNVQTFDGSGGAIHCITKQIPAESPVRILHSSLTGDITPTVLNEGNIAISAYITNNSGIAQASVYWRHVGDEQWQNASLTGGADSLFSGAMSGLQAGDSIEYYLSATSVAGKTITKPYTAATGGYYTFTLAEPASSGISHADLEAVFGQFYPNPATSTATLMLPAERYEVSIVDAAGRTVGTYQTAANGLFSVDASKLQSGIYTVVFSVGTDRVARKLVVK